jgi:hypothetical protein
MNDLIQPTRPSPGFFMPEVYAPGLVHVAAAPHPFRASNIVTTLPAGLSIAEILAQVQPDPRLRRYAFVQLGGETVMPEYWHRVRPKEGAHLTIRVVPQGGGGANKSDVATVLSIVVLVAAAVVSSNPAFLGLTATQASLAGVAVGVAGALAINALVPPPGQDLDRLSGNSRSSPALSGASNQMRPYGVVPLILGRHRVFPPLAAPVFTEIVGNKQFLRALFVVGRGPLALSQFRIGETAFSKFKKATLRSRQGFPNESAIKLFPNIVREQPLIIKLRQADGWRQKRTEPETDEASVDITLPLGLQRTNGTSGDRDPLTVDVEVEYREVGSGGAWSVGSGGLSIAARLSAVMAEPASHVVRFQDQNTVLGKAQIFRVIMDPQSGDLETLAGEAVPNFHISGTELPTDVRNSLLQDPEGPPWPADKVRLAEVLRVTNEATIGASRITDMRNTANALPDFTSFEFATDFLPGPDSPVSNKIEIAAGKLFFGGFIVTAKRPTTIRRSLLIQFPSRGQYDIRMRRTTADRPKIESDGDTNQDEVFWSTLRSINLDPPITDAAGDLALVAIRVQATDQLNGTIDQFNCVAESILPDWDGVDWTTERPTRNPASHIRAILQGAGNARPLADSRLDLAGAENGLQAFHEYCTDNDWRFDMVRDFPATVWEALRDVASAGRAAQSTIDGLWGVVIDQLKSVPVQHFTPRNSFGFSGSKAFADLPEGFRVRYSDAAKRWKQKELIVARDGFDPATITQIEGMDLPGITDKKNIRRHARLHLAQIELRPEGWTLSTDVESLVCTRGDFIKITHDVILAGLAYGRIKGVTVDGSGDVTGLDLDEAVPMEVAKTYAISIRTTSDAALSATVVTDPGEQTTVSISPVIPAANAPAVGDLFGFGETGLETLDAIVRSIEPGNDLTYRVTCVPAAAALHSADSGTIPEFDPGISEPIGIGKPAVEEIRSDESVLVRSGDGSLASRILVTLFRPSGLPDNVMGVEAQIRPADGLDDWTGNLLLPRDAGEVSFLEVEDGETYEFRLRYFFVNADAGEWTAEFSHTVIGKSTPPPDITDFRVIETVIGGVSRRKLVWIAPTLPPDFDAYELRHRQGTVIQWDGMEVLPNSLISGTEADISTLPRGIRTFAIRMRDVAGNLSATPNFLTTDFGDAPVENIVLTIDEDTRGWPGTITNGTLSAGDIVADGDGALYLANGDAPYLPDDGTNGTTDETYLPVQFKELIYDTSIVPSDADTPARLALDVTREGEGLSIGYKEDSQDTYLPDGALIYLGGATEDAELYLPGLTTFAPWQEGQQVVHQRYDLRFTVPAGNVQGKITDLQFVLDVPDIEETLTDVAIASGGTRLPITKTYRQIVSVQLTLQDTGTAVALRRADLDATIGPLIKALDAAGAATTATIDAVVKGY